MEDESGASRDAVVDDLTSILTRLAAVVADAVRGDQSEHRDHVDDATRIDRIAALEQLKGAAAAAQAAETVRFARSQVADQLAADVDPRSIGRGIAEQLGMATKVGPWHGARRLGLARALWFDLPATFDLLVRGEISEYVASLVATQTSHLAPETRREVDQQIVADGLQSMAPKQAQASAKRRAYQADPAGWVRRGRTARADRRVTLRPAPDTMSVLSALLPVEQGVACSVALRRTADTLRSQGDGRSRDQIMADTLVERLTGQTRATDVNVEVEIVIPVDLLVDPDDPVPAEVPGFGPLPSGLIDDLLAASEGRKHWRRVFTAPGSGGATVVNADPTARRFTGTLARVLRLRDQHCREPYCTAPIRHLDHILAHRDGGPTTLANGRGVCERHNYVREMPGWNVVAVHPDDPGSPHLISTPTGHRYPSTAPPLVPSH